MKSNASMDINLKEEMTTDNTEIHAKSPVISVVGVGGGGNNMISHLYRVGTYPDIKLVIANTDLQHMKNNPAHTHILLGAKTTGGKGAGMRPEIGRKAAEESYDDVKKVFSGSDLVIVCAGLGGGTGTGAAPVIANAAKEAGALTIGVVTTPFKMEGKKRAKLAQESLALLKDACDSIVVIPNTRLSNMIDKNTSYEESMSYVDDVLARAVNGIASIILSDSGNGINLDFADLRTIVEGKGLALMSIGEADGEDSVQKAVSNAIESPLFEDISIRGSMGILISFEINPKMPMYQITSVVESLEEMADEDADIIFGTIINESFSDQKVRVSVIATGFRQQAVANSIQDSVSVTAPQQEMVQQVAQQQKQNSIPVQRDLFSSHHPDVFMTKVKVSSSDYSDDELELPSYYRQQQD